MDILNNILAPLIVAAMTGIFGWLWAHKRIQKKVDDAPNIYVQELDYLISRAVKEGLSAAVVNARAIVAARNSMRKSLISISGNLNSEIDRLAEEIGQTSEMPLGPSTQTGNTQGTNAEKAFETIQVLSRVWPAKKKEIIIEVRKLLAELGLADRGFRN